MPVVTMEVAGLVVMLGFRDDHSEQRQRRRCARLGNTRWQFARRKIQERNFKRLVVVSPITFFQIEFRFAF